MSGLRLNEWFRILGFHPWHSYQLANSIVPITADCSTVVREYAWQNVDAVGRFEIRQAIEQAEHLIHQYAGRWPSPRFVETTIPVPQPGDNRLVRWSDSNYRGQWLGLILPDTDIQCAGVEAESTPSTVDAVYSDEDGDTLNETVTLVATVPAGTQDDEVVVQFLAADCGPIAPPEVPPRSVSIVGTTATIVLNGWECVRPVLYQGAATTTINPSVPASFAAQFAVFRRYCNVEGTTEATAHAVLTWETRPCTWPLWCTQFGDSSDPAAVATAIARVTLRNTNAGIVAFGEAVYNSASDTWGPVACDYWRCSPPDRITLRYQAGVPRVGLAMDAGWRLAVARLAAAELTRPVCGCTAANKELYEWQQDLSRTGASDELFAAPTNASNPFGAKRGQIYAWNFVQREQRAVGVFAG